MKVFNKAAQKYALYGALFGFCFPILATILETLEMNGSLSLSFAWKSQTQSSLLWIINTAPFFLGLFAYFIGQQVDKVEEKSREIIKAQQKLILQEKMASIGQMTAGIAHEIKNPLNFITNFSESSIEIVDELYELMLNYRELYNPDDYEMIREMIFDLKQNATDVKNNGLRVNQIILALLDHTRGGKAEKRLTQLNELLEANLNLAFQGYKANHPSFNLEIVRDYSPDVKGLVVNPHSLGRVLLNIINNACYALQQKQNNLNGQYRPVLELRTSDQEDIIKITIHDNGSGIPSKIRESIFEPFFTTKPTGQANTGLGLSISKDIITQEHGGQIKIESEEGAFTEFIIMLPKSPAL